MKDLYILGGVVGPKIEDSLPSILGLASRLNLSEESQEKIRAHILAKIGWGSVDSSEKIELRIRVLVERHAPWSEIQPHVRQWLKGNLNAINCARAIELSALYGEHDSAILYFKLGESLGPTIFHELHAKVRNQITSLNFLKPLGTVISSILISVRNEAWLLPIERTLIFYKMLNEKEKSFLYLRTFKEQIFTTLDEIQASIGVPCGGIYFAAARNALELGGKKEATELLKKVLVSDSYYQVAIKLLISVEEDEKSIMESSWTKDLLSRSDWQDRISRLEEYLIHCRSVQPNYHELFPILNTLFLHPELISQEMPTAISKLSKMILNYLDLKTVIPNIDYLFRSNIKIFYSSNKDGAIWQSILRSESHLEIEPRWRAVALVHRYVSGGPNYEADLMAAQGLFQEKSIDPLLGNLRWHELIQAALFAVFHSSSIAKIEKDIMESQLLVADEAQMIRIKHIEQYLDRVEKPNYLTLKRLSDVAENRRSDYMVLSLSRKMCATLWYRNVDLDRLWRVALEKSNTDLAWRIASVAKFREVLDSSVTQAWSVSGESRSIYTVPVISKNQIAACLEDLGAAEQRFCLAIIGMEGRLKEIFPEVDPNLVEYRWKPTVMRDEHMILNLKRLPWFAIPKKRLSKQVIVDVGPLPVPYAEYMPTNDWTDALCWISENTGVTFLSDITEETIRLADQISAHLQPKRGLKIENASIKWIKSLTPNQRSAWHDLIFNMRRLSKEQVTTVMHTLVIRIATLVQPNHALALKSLSEMRAPLSMIRDLENWTLSDKLTSVRNQLGRSSGIPLPRHLNGTALLKVSSD